MPPLSTTRMRLERLADERARMLEKIEDTLQLAETEKRDVDDLENKHLVEYRQRTRDLEDEITVLADDLKRADDAVDVSALLRREPQPVGAVEPQGNNGPVIYRTFAAYARDLLLVRYPILASNAGGNPEEIRELAAERLRRSDETYKRVQNTLTTDVAGLLPPQHLAQIMDIINSSRPVVTSARNVPLTTGKLTYPRITGRPQVLKQAAEKTEAGTAKMSVVLDTVTADTYLGGGDLSWQAINWSTPDALQLWFNLAAEAYAQQTETASCSELGTAGGGTITPALGTTGTESFAAWRAAALKGLQTLYNNSAGRAQSNTLWVSADRFFQLAGLGTDQVLQVSSVGNFDIGSMTGTWAGLRVIGSYGFGAGSSQAIIGDAGAFLVAESPNAPVEMRAVEPAIGGMEVGVIGGFKAKVFDPARFIHLS